MKESYLIGILACIIISGAFIYFIYYMTAPKWYLYHKDYGYVHSVQEFDEKLPAILDDINTSFPLGTTNINFDKARETVRIWEGTTRCKIETWCWLWEGNPNQPQWEIVKTWKDKSRMFDYTDKTMVNMAHFNVDSPLDIFKNKEDTTQE